MQPFGVGPTAQQFQQHPARPAADFQDVAPRQRPQPFALQPPQDRPLAALNGEQVRRIAQRVGGATAHALSPRGVDLVETLLFRHFE